LKKIAFLEVFEQKFTMGSYGIKIEHVRCCPKAWRKFDSCERKKLKNKKTFLSLQATKTPNNQNLVLRNFRGKASYVVKALTPKVLYFFLSKTTTMGYVLKLEN
jgi:hypothetical protein